MKKILSLTMVVALLVSLLCACSVQELLGMGQEVFVPASTDHTKPKAEDIPEYDAGKILETKYFNIVMPNSWVGNYCAQVPEESGYNIDTGEFEYAVCLYEKTGYQRNRQGHLVDIILTSNPDYQSFASGGKIGHIMADQQYYLFARYPTDVQFDLDNQKIYTQMYDDVSDVVEGIYSDIHVITLYDEEEPDWEDDDFLLPHSSDSKLTEADIEELMNNTYRESPSGSYVQDAINEIYARNGYVFQNENLMNYYLRQDWYWPDSSFTPADLNEIENYNIALLQTFL